MIGSGLEETQPTSKQITSVKETLPCMTVQFGSRSTIHKRTGTTILPSGTRTSSNGSLTARSFALSPTPKQMEMELSTPNHPWMLG